MSWSIYRNSGKGDLVTPESLGAAQEHKIIIDVMPPNKVDGTPLQTIVGFSKESFTYSVQAEYSNILGWSDPPSLAFNIFKDITQRNTSLYSGYGSKRMFNPGKSYVQLNLKFRAYDEPDIISKCDLLTKCCLPIISRNNFMLNTDAIAVGSNLIKNVAGTFGESTAEMLQGNIGDSVGTVVKDITDNISTKMPPHLRISIGSYFKKAEMVLTNCSFTFSKEFTRYNGGTYPTYVDFDLQVESLYSSLAMSNPTDNASELQSQIFGPGFSVKSEQSRVVIDKYESDNPISTTMDSISNAWSIATSQSPKAGTK
jgi:hypothetical protein